MELTIATKEDISSLINIWRRCFIDDMFYLEQFFAKCFPSSRTYVFKDNGLIVSSISLFNLIYVSDNEHFAPQGAYLYGVCTLPRYRGKHLTAKLIARAIDESQKSGYCFLITRPATASLFALYRKLGFTQPIYRQYVDLPLPLLSDGIAYSELDSFRLKTLRLKYLRSNYFEWDNTMLDYIIEFYKQGHGIVAELEYNRYFIGYPDEEETSRFDVLEMGTYSDNIKYPSFQIIGAHIKAKYPESTKARIFFPAYIHYDDLENVNKEAFSLLMPLSVDIDSDAFFNFPME